MLLSFQNQEKGPAKQNFQKQIILDRVPEENDARYKRIVFQDKAAGIKDALRAEIEESEALLLRGISKEEKEIFLRVAQKMLENLDSD